MRPVEVIISLGNCEFVTKIFNFGGQNSHLFHIFQIAFEQSIMGKILKPFCTSNSTYMITCMYSYATLVFSHDKIYIYISYTSAKNKCKTCPCNCNYCPLQLPLGYTCILQNYVPGSRLCTQEGM